MRKTVTVQVGNISSSSYLGKDRRGGVLIAEVCAVHTWGCPVVRWRNKRLKGKPCDCGASELYDQWKAQTDERSTPAQAASNIPADKKNLGDHNGFSAYNINRH